MVGGAVGAVSAIDRLDHLTDLEGRVVCGAPRNQLCPPADSRDARDERRVRARRRSRPAAQHWAPAACAARHGSACSLRARRVCRPRYAACRWAAGCSRQSTRRARRAGQLPRTSVMMCCPVRSWRTLTPMPTRVSCWRVPGTLASLLLNSADRNSAIPAPRRNARLLKSVCWCGARKRRNCWNQFRTLRYLGWYTKTSGFQLIGTIPLHSVNTVQKTRKRGHEPRRCRGLAATQAHSCCWPHRCAVATRERHGGARPRTDEAAADRQRPVGPRA